MSSAYLLDTNVLIDFLNQHPDSIFQERVLTALESRSGISVITTIELLGWRKHTTQTRQGALDLLGILREYPLGRAEAQVAIQLRTRSAIHLGDAIIAATALTHGLPLMTRNMSDFKEIDALTLINPFEEA
ncbi:MAG: type II toxin-antitoxin system VapC family toxin [Magnetococcales bacterium]|nr:type II toxin-antitoxin system VapC family toxin [Magnetococcales bacterium]